MAAVSRAVDGSRSDDLGGKALSTAASLEPTLGALAYRLRGAAVVRHLGVLFSHASVLEALRDDTLRAADGRGVRASYGPPRTPPCAL
jgi:hypothetical protein